MGEVADAIKVIAELGQKSATVTQQTEVESRLKALEDALKKALDDRAAADKRRTSEIVSAVKFLLVVGGVILLMWLAGDHVERILRPKVPTLAQRIGQFAYEHDSKSADRYLDDCMKEFQSLRASLVSSAPPHGTASAAATDRTQAASPRRLEVELGVAAPSLAASQPLRIPAQQVAKLRTVCGQVVGE
jgi:hypothetical protein